MKTFVHYLKQIGKMPLLSADPKFSVWGYASFLSSPHFNLHFSWMFASLPVLKYAGYTGA